MRAFKSVFLVGGLSAVFFGAVFYVTPNLETYAGTEVHGPFSARVIDGDTLSDGVQKFRLVGVDACEMGQPIDFNNEPTSLDCGYYAKSFVVDFIGDGQVVCHDQGSRSYGRIVARCFRSNQGSGRSIDDDIGAFALHSGWAVVTEYAKVLYAFRYWLEELVAKVSLRGAWNGETMTPTEWRTRG